MSLSDSNPPSFLDKLRNDSGVDECKKFFSSLVRKNTRKSLRLINDEQLNFSTLFALQPVIRKHGLYRYLTVRNKNALNIASQIRAVKNGSEQNKARSPMPMTHYELKWMLETGYRDDGLSNEYGEVLDSVSILLARQYKDKAALNIIAEMLFNRYRNKAFIYDLAWGLLESSNPDCLVLIAERLNSDVSSDVELARKLLSFIPCMNSNTARENKKLYQAVSSWIHENYPFLYYTGEGFQQTSNPVPYAVSYEAKYLCRPVYPESGKIKDPLGENENKLLSDIKDLDSTKKSLLANYSYRLYCQNIYWWNKWLTYPVAEQVRIAETMTGGLP
ncbi:MAG: hypothetical protein N3I35_01725 [Clostridia bacterium]|nr:hypothetical protein [Clostridia bacterium]